MAILRSISRFCYDIVVGDDWKVAASVLGALLSGVALAATSVGPWLAPLTAVILGAAFSASVILDARRRSR